MASIVLLLSELLGRAESTGVLAANCYMSGHSLRDFRPAAATTAAKGERAPAEAKQEAAAEARREEENKGESFEDLAVYSRIAVDVMWP